MAILDVWESLLLEASYGETRIDLVDFQTSEGNDLVRHQFPRRDGVELDHQGNRARATTVSLAFFETIDQGATDLVELGAPSPSNHIERYKAFRALAHDGEAHFFVHPFQGSYLARVEDFETTADADTRDMIRVSCTFVEVVEQASVFDSVSAGVQTIAGVDVVAAAAATAREDLDELPEGASTTTLPEQSIVLSRSWQDRGVDLSSREVGLELATFSNDFQDSLDELDLATDVDTYLPARSLTLLHYQMLKAAETFIQTTSRIIELTVAVPTPLRVIAARLYGALQSDTRYEEMIEINDIRQPGLIPGGTVLKAEAPSVKTGTASGK